MENHSISSHQNVLNVSIIQCPDEILEIVIKNSSHYLPIFLLEKYFLSSFGCCFPEKPYACDIRKYA